MRHSFSGRLRCALLSAALLLTGCPYGSEFALDDPAAGVIDEALLGAWKGTDADGEPVAFSITASGAGGLAFSAAEPGGTGAEPMPAFVTLIDGERFLNVYDEAWFFLNYRVVAADGVLMRLVDDALFESRSFASPVELRAFLQAHLTDPLLYGQEAGEAEAWDFVLQRAAAPHAAAPPAGAVPPAATSP